MEYGWFVASFLVGWEFNKLETLVDDLRSHPPMTDGDRIGAEERIYRALCDVAFHHNYRARSVWLGLKLPHFSDYSHIYESGIFAYYKRDFISAILCLLAAMEGTLLSFCGWNPAKGEQKPSYKALITAVRNTQFETAKAPTSTAAAHDLFRDTLVEFLDRWLYRPTQKSDYRLSYLNRHLASHGLEPANFYRPADVHRLILAFDLLIDLIAEREGIHYLFLPDDGQDPIFDKRRNYYYQLSLGFVSVVQGWMIEREMLADHPKYERPKHEPNLVESIGESVKILTELMSPNQKNRQSKSNP